jgi:sulfur carrier protein
MDSRAAQVYRACASLDHYSGFEVAWCRSTEQDGTLRFSMNVTINGHTRALELSADATLDQLVTALELKGDRIAVEHNGTIVPRTQWSATTVTENDRFEIVHFVGGGCWAHGQ